MLLGNCLDSEDILNWLVAREDIVVGEPLEQTLVGQQLVDLDLAFAHTDWVDLYLGIVDN